MNIEKQLASYKQSAAVVPKETKLRETIRKSTVAFYAAEGERVLAYKSFLWMQFKITKKRWWLFQTILLFALLVLLPLSEDQQYMHRNMGIGATLFVVLIIPELWKNRMNQSMEIEASSYYSLRQIYAARMLLFGMADVVLISCFCCAASISLNLALTQLLIQFLFPMVVTACICFGILCSPPFLNESAAIVLCLIWSAVWGMITLNETIYLMITLPVWILLMGIALVFLLTAVYRSFNRCNDYWEVNFNGTEGK